MTASVRQGRALYYWLYPNFMLNWYEGYLDTNLVLPLAQDCRRDFRFLFRETGDEAADYNARVLRSAIACRKRIWIFARPCSGV